jgi:RNA polymerase sigma-70 factor (ECF subfamily)
MPNQEDIGKPAQVQAHERSHDEAFMKLVRENQSFAYSLAFRFLGNAADAEDAVQESFLRVWKHLSEYDPQRKFTTWLYRIVANVCFDALKSGKRKGRTGQVPLNHARIEISDPGDDPARELDKKEAVRMVHEFARELPGKQRMVFVLRDLENLSIEETAAALRMTEGSVKNNLVHARKFLRAKMEEQYKTGQ